MKFKKKGGISIAVMSIIGILLLSAIFFHYYFIHLDLERYNLINQYTRDMLLIAETKDSISGSYFRSVKNKLSSRIVKKDTEYVKIYVTVNGVKYDVDSMGQIKTDYGEPIEILTEYHYEPQRIIFNKGLIPTKDTGMEVMGVKLTTISKNRGTSDG